MVFLETALESKFNPLVALGRSGSLGLTSFVNKFNLEAELLDDLVSFFPSVFTIPCLRHFCRMITGPAVHTRWDLSSSLNQCLTSVSERTKLVC